MFALIKFKRPLMWFALVLTGSVMLFMNIYVQNMDIPRMSAKECEISGYVKNIEYKNDKVYVYLKEIQIWDTETDEDSNKDKDTNSDKGTNSGINRNSDKGLYENQTLKNIITDDEIRDRYFILKNAGCICYFDKNSIFDVLIDSDKENKSTLSIGSKIRVKGKLSVFENAHNPGEFDARKYYISKGYIYSMNKCEILSVSGGRINIAEITYEIRQKVSAYLDNALGEKDAGIMKAVLIADKTGIDSEVKDLYKDAGASHLLAISGLHITMFASLLLFVLKKTPIKLNADYIITIVFLFAYGYIIGFTSSALRAIIMFTILMIGKMLGKSYDTLTAAAFAALITLIFKPRAMLETGFLLSYLAIISIAIVVPIFKTVGKNQSKIAASVGMSVSVSLMILPVLMNTYYKIPIYSSILNILLVAGMTALLGLGLCCLFFEIIIETFGLGIINVFALLIQLMLRVYEWLMKLELSLPKAIVITGHRNMVRCIIYEVILILICVLIWKIKLNSWREYKKLNNYQRHHPFYNASSMKRNIRKKKNSSLAIGYSLLVINVITLTFYKRDNRIEFLDVGQGLCACVQFNGQVYFYDGGSTSEKNIYEYVIEPYMNYYAIDCPNAWFISHDDADHTSGIKEFIEANEIKTENKLSYFNAKNNPHKREDDSNKNLKNKTQIIVPYALKDKFNSITEEASKAEMEVIHTQIGNEFYTSDKDLKFTVLFPESDFDSSDSNAASQVVLLEAEGFRILFMGDADIHAEEKVIEFFDENNIDRIDILQAAHHGSCKNTNNMEFLRRVNPYMSVISCGFENRYGHPHEETIENLEDISTCIMRTDQSGAIRIKLD